MIRVVILFFVFFCYQFNLFSQSSENKLYSENGKVGLINKDGGIVLPAKYDRIYDPSEGISSVRLNSKWGTIDFATGKELAPLKYNYVDAMSGGFARVNVGATVDQKSDKLQPGGLWGVIDKNGNEVLAPNYQQVHAVGGGGSSFKVTYLNENIIVDNQGKKLKDYALTYEAMSKAKELSEISGTMERFNNGDGTFGFINADGVLIKPEYDEANEFHNGYATVSKNKLWGMIDEKGNTIIDYKYSKLGFYSEGLISIYKNMKWGFMDMDGKMVIDFIFENYHASPPYFIHSLALVVKDSKYGYINTKGEVIVPIKYAYAQNFQGGLGAVTEEENGKKTQWAFVNKKGELVTGFKYYNVANYSYSNPKNGPIKADKNSNGDGTYLDSTGKEICPECKTMGKFSNGLVSFCKPAKNKKFNGLFGFMDKSGNVIIPDIYYEVSEFKDSLAVVTVVSKKYNYEKRKGLINTKGETLVPPIFELITFKEDEKIDFRFKIYGGPDFTLSAEDLRKKKDLKTEEEWDNLIKK
jgi:hypothetical protein